ncbi:class I SAM-dependent methyltransferase [Metabacillus sp. KIGAM252]|uniref:Class I SAM-dependent methyltransferase n=1 Tax=Metabacillus flavus TaxID=2823519 RepID=A0ABS5LA96_9BACI|nr:class I SAM-dependent methyltransferase [Metabacillus flavus]MBS2967635.1 class I SAM-dependent methyltransferase [Metabacillus flavus]
MKEAYYDHIMNVKTERYQKEILQAVHYHYHRYEPTPYRALDALFEYYKLESGDHVVDFGCGMGRLIFYIHYHFNASVTGIEMNEGLYESALENLDRYGKKTKKNKDKINFQCCLAEEYSITDQDNRFYFFNPFSIQVFIKIVNNILLSVEKEPRETELVLYYPSEEYILFLENQTGYELKEEVYVPELYDTNPAEKFMIYRLSFLKD